MQKKKEYSIIYVHNKKTKSWIFYGLLYLNCNNKKSWKYILQHVLKIYLHMQVPISIFLPQYMLNVKWPFHYGMLHSLWFHEHSKKTSIFSNKMYFYTLIKLVRNLSGRNKIIAT